MAGGSRRRAAALAACVGLVASLFVLLPAAPADAAAPSPTVARTGKPTSIAVIGDSISTATGTGPLGEETPQNSWVTGNAAWSMRGLLGIAGANAYNMAHNGKRIDDFDNQASSLPTDTQYVVVELGGNDLCRPSVGEMTSEANYRQEVRNGLAALRARVPNALIFLAGIPDIYNLWYLRGAPRSVNPYVADETGQDGQAHFYWDNGLVDIIPCKSLLENPTSTSAGDEARRQQVRTRTQAFNRILREECAQVLRCRHDGELFFNFSSNRATPPDGPLLPRNQWRFTDTDISHNTGWLASTCPVPYIVNYSGCGDHFHPSIFGQQKLAAAGNTASYQWATDSTAPTVALTPERTPDGAAQYASAVDVTVTGADASGVRGYEVRVHQPNGAVTPWSEYVGPAPDVTVSTPGQSYVEARALDNNGNLSASTIIGIDVNPSAFGSIGGTITDGDGDPIDGIQVELHAAATEAALATDVVGADGTYAFGPILTGTYKLEFTDPAGHYVGEWHDNAASHATATTVVVGPAASVDVDAQLALVPGTISGTVEHRAPGPPDREPVAGVEVTAVPDGGGFGDADVTDASGAYQLNLPPGEYDVQFADPGDHVAQTVGATVTGGQVTDLDVLLQYDIPGAPFTDFGNESTDWARFFGLVTGFPDATYQPDGNLTRGQIANMLWNLADVPPGSPPHGFRDVAPTAWFGPALDWARAEQLVTGFPDGTYRSREPVNRGQLVNMLWQLVGAPTGSPAHGFSDVRPGIWYGPALDWARAHGLVNVIGVNSFEPKRAATRAEVALILHNLAADESAWTTWSDALPHTVLF